MKKRKALSLILAFAAAAALLTGCKGESTITDDLTDGSEDTMVSTVKPSSSQTGTIHNFEAPQPGEKIAVITVKDYGEIKIKFFPELAPKAVENFIGLAEMGYYDELIFHRIIKNFMIQGGDPRGDGTGGKSMWGEAFDGEVADGLYHFSGAVAYAHSAMSFTNGSQFYIVNTPEGFLDNTCEDLNRYDPYKYNWPSEVMDMYREKGGTPFLDGDYTVFGQVIEGLDIVRELGNVETNENDKPLKQVQIESVKIVEYGG